MRRDGWEPGRGGALGRLVVGVVAVVMLVVAGAAVASAQTTDGYLTPTPGGEQFTRTPPSPANVEGLNEQRGPAEPRVLAVERSRTAFTGADILELALIGTGAVAVGCVLVTTSRRRRRASAVLA